MFSLGESVAAFQTQLVGPGCLYEAFVSLTLDERTSGRVLRMLH